MKRFTITALALALAAPAFAQEATTIEVAESETFGQHLVTGDGRPVYLFTTDTQGGEGQEATVSCTSAECLQAWPLVTSTGEPEAGSGAMADMLGTTTYEGQQVVTYNGWPLYHFVRDEGAEAPQGQEIESFGGEWYLVSPEGERVEN